jgi:carboxymethylenebutenolidase
MPRLMAGVAELKVPLLAEVGVGRTGTRRTDGFKMPAYRAAPAGKTGLPVVLVISEIFGVHEYIADTARRFAKAGYLAIAPELFVRQGDARQLRRDGQADGRGGLQGARCPGHGRPGRLPWPGPGQRRQHQPQVASPASAGAGASPGCTPRTTRVKAGVAWYGRLVGASTAADAQAPGRRGRPSEGPVLGLYGGQDTGIPLDTVEKMKAALAAGNAAAKASSSWSTPTRRMPSMPTTAPATARTPADDGWKRALDWFKANGVA